MRARARVALIGVALLLIVFFVARRLGEEDRAAPGEVSNNAAATELPADPPIDGDRPSLLGGWKPEDLTGSNEAPAQRSPQAQAGEDRERNEPPELTEAIDPEGERIGLRGEARFGRGRILFVPETIALQVDQTLKVFNDDPTLHNVHAIVKRSEFNQAMPKQGQMIEKSFKARDLDGRLSCEVHPWMTGSIFVFDHPFFSISDSEGKFVIDRLPGDGPYRLIVRHPTLGTQERIVNSGTLDLVL